MTDKLVTPEMLRTARYNQILEAILPDKTGQHGKALVVNTNENGFEWTTASGEKGDTGETGQQGIQGIQGETGSISGLTATIEFEDNDRNDHTIVIENGLIQSWSIV